MMLMNNLTINCFNLIAFAGLKYNCSSALQLLFNNNYLLGKGGYVFGSVG